MLNKLNLHLSRSKPKPASFFKIKIFNVFPFKLFEDIRLFLWLFVHTNVYWLKEIIQNMVFEAKFDAESDPIAKKIEKID